ncbi:type I restriction-modification system, M subunit (plasmid) [Leptolyngbya sp. NIES-3755]|nr:type I restriction-modification system, M subunit [Leptolyngbya sp. NIES-3755]
MPYMLAQMNLLLNGVEYPDVERKNSLSNPINQIGVKDQVDIVLANPPFGGEEEAKIKDNFDPKMQTSETALLFLQLIMRLLKSQPKPGRAGIVVPNGTLFGDGVAAKIKEKLLTEYNLHTIVRLPNGVFAPYTSIPTNLLFFDASGATEEIWYYEVPLPEGRKSFSKTKPMQESDFDGCFAWWNDRTENEQAWKYHFGEAYRKAKSEAQPHWDAARKAEANANRNAKRMKELETEIQNINSSLLDFAPDQQQAQIKQRIQELKDEQKQVQAEERQQREIARQEQARGDSLYWYIYNLDQKNPNAQNDFEHLPPEQLVADIWSKEQRILEILGEIKDVLQARVPS